MFRVQGGVETRSGASLDQPIELRLGLNNGELSDKEAGTCKWKLGLYRGFVRFRV